MKKFKLIIAFSLFSLSTYAQTFVEANVLTGFNNTIPNVGSSAVAFADVNNDGRPDVLITGLANTNIAKLYTNSGTNFEEVTTSTFTGVINGSVAFSDVNNDTFIDVLIIGKDKDAVFTAKLYTNSGTNFKEVIGTSFFGVEFGSVAFSDVNGDTKPDVLISGTDGTVFCTKLYTNSGTNFTEVTTSTFTGVGNSSIAFADVNGDTKPDVAISGSDYYGAVYSLLYTNSGTNFTEVTTSTFTGASTSSIAFSDVNNDGKPDLLITGYDVNVDPISKLYTNSGTNFKEVSTSLTGVYSGSIAFSDVNSDGKPDVLISGFPFIGGDPITKLYTNSGTNFTLVNTFTGVGNSSVAFSDVNSDGKQDLLITGYVDLGIIKTSKLYINQGAFSIKTQPIANTNACSGNTITFTVSATGSSECNKYWDIFCGNPRWCIVANYKWCQFGGK